MEIKFANFDEICSVRFAGDHLSVSHSFSNFNAVKVPFATNFRAIGFDEALVLPFKKMSTKKVEAPVQWDSKIGKKDQKPSQKQEDLV